VWPEGLGKLKKKKFFFATSGLESATEKRQAELLAFMACSLNEKMEEILSSEMSADNYRTQCRHIPEDNAPDNDRREYFYCVFASEFER
jgi:hypothetical protein